ncbi:hypothetical protein WICPIJ_005255 [Wickerhamomyces pijperi]|uniref:Chromatin modification-related protein EAF6 n=1 Tax=Wickerhamomyces pijperi TaxID=599730 RepID=A0A9P8TM56_WICPI|nr:hypothetical protein WICPIJ_005255 [Wickerhamomyces pijperi]
MSDPAKIAEYEELKKQLQDAILRKKTLDRELQLLEEDLFYKEGLYLADNSNGTIVRGFESLNKLAAANATATTTSATAAAAAAAAVSKKGKQNFSDEDRVFSLSSNNYVRHLQKSIDGDDDTETTSLSVEGTPKGSANSSVKRRRRDE